MRFFVIALAVALLSACHGDRPKECQKLRQCCAHAKELNQDLEVVRVQCTRKEDDDAVICRRRLDDVVAASPSLADDEACRMPAQ